MKLPDALNQFIHKTPEREEAYLSLVLEEMAVQAAIWTLRAGKKPHIGEATTERVAADPSERLGTGSWEKRLEACDRAIAKLAQKEGRDDFEKVVLGLPAYYLTAEDDIEHAVRTHIKTITEELELTPIGFVPLHQSLVHKIKKEEGVPPSVILLEVGTTKTAVILYKVGAVAGRASIGNDDLVPELERTLKGFKELEVLPSRILLYGANEETLEGYKRDLLKHPWPTRANFLHYPKIEILPTMALAGAVSLAGASELASQMGEEKVEIAAPAIQGEAHEQEEHQTTDDEFDENGKVEEIVESENTEEADENVVEVPPETLGFRRNVDILEKPMVREEAKVQEETEEMQDSDKAGKMEELKETLARFVSGVKLPRVQAGALPKTGILAFIILVLFLGAVGWLTYWVLPQAKVTLYQVPQTVSAQSAVTINPTATVGDAATKTIPGRSQEKSVSGQKTIAVTGKKDVGDPARGTVTVYNKSLTGKQLKKGTVLTAGSLSFTLDADVAIASASESLASGSVTYGKASVAISAAKLGPQSNLPASTEFVIRDTATSVMIARNDAALSGGTSKVVTVVSRADYDALVDGLTKDLIEKAKAELASSVAGGERLIDETVKTSVTRKDFDAELDQEARELHGSITVSISGISYSDEDVASLFADLVAANVPSGYTLGKNGGSVHASNVKLQKDGSIGVSVEYRGQALPTFDLPAIRSKLAGKSIGQAQEELKGVTGMGGMEIAITRSLWGKKFPANAGNISVSVAVLE